MLKKTKKVKPPSELIISTRAQFSHRSSADVNRQQDIVRFERVQNADRINQLQAELRGAQRTDRKLAEILTGLQLVMERR